MVFRDLFLHLPDKGEGFPHIEVNVALPAFHVLCAVVLQLVLRIRQSKHDTALAGVSIVAHFYHRTDEGIVSTVQIDGLVSTVYQTEELGSCQYEVVHSLFLFDSYTSGYSVRTFTIVQTTLPQTEKISTVFVSR